MSSSTFLFSQLFKQYREKNNLSQAQLAERLGVRYEHINRIENQKSFPSAELIEVFFSLYCPDFDSVLNRYAMLFNQPDLIALFELLEQMNPLQIKQILGVAKVIQQT